MKRLSKTGLGVIISGCVLIGAAGQAYSAPADGSLKAESGTLACGGTNMLQTSGAGLKTLWILRNYDMERPINIDRVRIFGADGNTLVDVPGSGVEPFNNFGVAGIPGSAAVIGPNQTLMLATPHLENQFSELQSESGKINRPLQFVVDWSAHKKALLLDGAAIIEKYDTSTGALTRHLYHCRTID